MRRYRFTYFENNLFAGTAFAESMEGAIEEFAKVNYLTDAFWNGGETIDTDSTKVEFVDNDGDAVAYSVTLITE
ncbi:hypothetical protein [Paenibacillus donghaensis]|uniref:Uncharacterized protein n=1 Tax=Paenibacillus donghaensis TaxID=414771 RepID=A0A2Z2K7G1_9BACL|nr:hypothetical protein [Paenibacillus donghaensis]ASA20974.1 hypothetical protein B9T62_09355 [Paenibacillus donghaensis]